MTLQARNIAFAAMLIFVGAVVLLSPLRVSATSGANNNLCTTTMPAALPHTVTQSDISVPRDLPVGSPIPGAHVDIHLTMQCNNGAFDTSTNIVNFDMFTDTALIAVTGQTNVYTWSSSLSGVGFRILNASGQPVQIGPVSTSSCTHQRAVLLGTGTNATTRISFDGALELVKIGNTVASGSQSISFRPGVCGQVWGNNNASDSYWTVTASITKPAVTTCTVSNSSISVAMPTVSGAALTSAGSTSGITPFQIGLNCNAGAMLYMTLTDASAPTNTSDKLTPTADSTAKGVSLQILRADGTTIGYGPDSPIPGTTNQHLIGATPNGALPVPLTVKYIRTGTVSAGSLNGKATFTLSYQ